MTVMLIRPTHVSANLPISCFIRAPGDEQTTVTSDNAEIFEVAEGTFLLSTYRGVVLARIKGGSVVVEPTSMGANHTIIHMIELPGEGVLVNASKGSADRRFLLLKMLNGKLQTIDITSKLPKDFLGFWAKKLPGEGMLVLSTDGGIYYNRAPNDWAANELFTQSAHIDGMVDALEITREAMLVQDVHRKWFLVHIAARTLRLEPVGPATDSILEVVWSAKLPDGTLLALAGDNYWYTVRFTDQRLLIQDVGHNIGVAPHQISIIGQLPGGQLLITTTKYGSFFGQMKDDHIRFTRIERSPDPGPMIVLGKLFETGILIQEQGRLSIARWDKEKVRFDPVSGTAKVGEIESVFKFDTGDTVFRTKQGQWYQAQVDRDVVTISPVLSARNFGEVLAAKSLPDADVLIAADTGLYFAAVSPFATARVEMRNFRALDGSGPDSKLDRNIDFSIVHACAPLLDQQNLAVRVTAPSGQTSLVRNVTITGIRPEARETQLSLRLLIDRQGPWQFQLVLLQQGLQTQIGSINKVMIESQSLTQRLQAFGVSLSLGVAVFLAISNAGLFAAAHRSPWAWRIVTQDSLQTAAFRAITFFLSHLQRAQIWIMDLYFQASKAQLKPPRPFLPLPLTDLDGRTRSSIDVVAFPWKGRRIWIQGNSGMGKTALFEHVVASHFRDHANAAEAFSAAGCIVVPFAARDYANGLEDRQEPDWVIDGIKGTLARTGLTFEDDKLLERILASGTLAVAIDGLHEAGRTHAVEAFARAFAAAPMLVTSQDSGSQQFANWRLPFGMGAFIRDLLALYLGPHDAELVMQRLLLSGLHDAIRSGYDVQLVVDIVRADSVAAPLPTDRAALYAAVVSKAWPANEPDVIHEQQTRIAAAAWKIMSERKPHEDIRRMRPDVDLDGELLVLLADAPEKYGRPVRLVRRVGATYEFVHDQMQAYLAARWFTQDGFNVGELVKMVSSSTIWTHPLSVRHVLWGFAAALLDDVRLVALLERVEAQEEWDALRRELHKEAERRGLSRDPAAFRRP